ncbi:class E sortase [Streptomyces reniochalinae]|uniref:Class E sortase n=1 Tax=Streptomyces reniochalinae TaxID=2250578 RepID=A0A367EGE7_9ACTN|nr:class E sortase [Streptomyces reniochalinae]RCG17121.1 class E sortase [Streptomyces reniochalinae]
MALRALVRTLSETCITIGLVIVLFVVYLLYWTGLRAEHASDDEIARLHKEWAQGPTDSTPADEGTAGGSREGGHDGGTPGGADELAGDGGAGGTGSAAPGHRAGESFAVMYIPRFGGDWSKPVLENTATATLRRGLGHYTGTADPGEKGNFAVAGHRRTYGDPFKDFPRLRPGDPVVVNDGDTWYTYTITARPYRTLPGDTGVLESVPEPVDEAATPFRRSGRYLTLTTCDPEWGSSHRLIAWGRLDATGPTAGGKPDALTRRGR